MTDIEPTGHWDFVYYNRKQAKPTQYAGVLYKSRLEGAWAESFDSNGLRHVI